MAEKQFEHRELVQCAEREVSMRERVYPGWTARGKMTHERAQTEIAKMRAIAEFLREHAPEPIPPPQGDLFRGGRR